MEMNIDAPNWVPVIYKSEIEPSNLSGFIPTLLIIGIHFFYSVFFLILFYQIYFKNYLVLLYLLIGFLLYMMRRSAEIMGAGGGRKRGGLFGGVMESTAKLINSTDIDVKFKYVFFISY